MSYVNKNTFLQYLTCPTLSWKLNRMKYHCINKFNAFEKCKVINILCSKYPNFINLENKSKHEINELLSIKNDKNVLCNISVVACGYKARVDILQKQSKYRSEWHLFLIKLSTKHKAKHINDISFIAMVLEKAKIKVVRTSILYISKDYRLGMDINNLFISVDCTDTVKLQTKKFVQISNDFFFNITSNIMPPPSLKSICKHCLVFYDCIGKNISKSIFNIPKLSSFELDSLIKSGIDIVDKIPLDFKLTTLQKRVKHCLLTNTTYISQNLKHELTNIKPPFFYLDFESVSTAIPLYINVAPNTQIVTQFSLDKTDKYGNILKHYEYITKIRKDCCHTIAKMLIKYLCVKPYSSIITYSNFESMYIKRLIKLFPDLNYKLTNILNRIIDLEMLIQRNYYNVNFRGKFSMKKVLTVTNPELNYISLDITNGQDAAVAYGFLFSGLYNKKKKKQIIKNLLVYCARDTLAMIKIHQFLISLI